MKISFFLLNDILETGNRSKHLGSRQNINNHRVRNFPNFNLEFIIENYSFLYSMIFQKVLKSSDSVSNDSFEF